MSHTTGEVVEIPFHGDVVPVVDVDGKPHLVLKPIIEGLGLDYWSQVEKLRKRSWAAPSNHLVQLPGQQQRREMVVINVRTFLMLLATIDENRVAKDVRAKLITYQAEVADAIEAYWTQGGAINPRASREQLNAIAASVETKIRMLGAAKGLVDDRWLEALTREQIAIGLGKEPEQDPSTRFLTVGEYLEEHGLTAKEIRKVAAVFGRRLKVAYVARHSELPGKSLRFVDGAQREVFVYTEADRGLFEAVWAEFSDDSN